MVKLKREKKKEKKAKIKKEKIKNETKAEDKANPETQAAEIKPKQEIIIREGATFTATEEVLEEAKEKQEKAKGRSERKKKIKLKLLISVAIILLLSSLATVFYVNKDSYFLQGISMFITHNIMGMTPGSGFPYDIIGSDTDASNISVNGDTLAVLSNASFALIDTHGEETLSLNHSFENPVMNSIGDKFILYSPGSPDYTLIDSSLTREMTLGDNISSAAIAKNGRYILATQPQDNASGIEVYLSDGTLKFSYGFNSFVTAVSLNSDASEGMVACIDSKNGVMFTTLYHFDFNKADPLSVQTIDNTVISQIYYNDSSGYYLVGDISMINYHNSNYTTFDYEGKRLTAVGYSDERLVLSLSSYSGLSACDIHVFSPNSQMQTFKVENEISSISSFGATFSLLSKSTVYSYDFNLKLLGTFDTKYDADSIVLLNERVLYILSAGQIKYGYIE